MGANPPSTFLYAPWSKVAILGMVIQPLIGTLIMGPYKPLRNWVDEFIPYYELIDPIAHIITGYVISSPPKKPNRKPPHQLFQPCGADLPKTHGTSKIQLRRVLQPNGRTGRSSIQTLNSAGQLKLCKSSVTFRKFGG